MSFVQERREYEGGKLMFGGQMMEENPGFLEKYKVGRRVSKPERAPAGVLVRIPCILRKRAPAW